MENILKYLTKAEYLFVLIAIIFGICFAKITPPLWGIDETAHFARTYQVVHGDVFPPKNPDGSYGGALPKNLVVLWHYTKSDLLDNKQGGLVSRKDVDSNYMYTQLDNQPFSKQQQTSPGSSIYSPIAYIAPMVGVFIADTFHASIEQTIFLARLCSLILYVALIWFGIRLLQTSKLKWLIFTIALLPTSLYQASVVSADNITIGLSLLFICLLVRLMQSKGSTKDKKLFYALAVVAAIIPLIKINYAFLSLALVLVPNNLFKSTKTAVVAKIGGISLAVTFGTIWSMIAKVTSNATASQRPDGAKVVAASQISLIAHHPLHFFEACARSIVNAGDSYFQSMIAILGWNFVSIPLIITFTLVLGILLAGLYAKDETVAMRKKLLLLNILIVGGVVSIFAALYITFNPTGNKSVDGVQGRYFLPFLAPVVMLLASLIPFEVKIKAKRTPFIFGTISAAGLIVSATYYFLVTY